MAFAKRYGCGTSGLHHCKQNTLLNVKGCFLGCKAHIAFVVPGTERNYAVGECAPYEC